MKKKYLLFISFTKIKINSFVLFDNNKERMYFGNGIIGEYSENITLNDFLKEFSNNEDPNLRDIFIEIPEDFFQKFIKLNFTNFLLKKQTFEIISSLQLEEFII